MGDETAIRARCDAGDHAGALTAAISMYGEELFGFLVGLARDRAHAEDVFSATCERIWRALPTFRWDSSFRSWGYRIARNTFLSEARRAYRREELAISDIAEVQVAIKNVTTAPNHQRDTVKEKFAQIRAELDADDHMLLGLRIDRQLGWADIARVMANDEAEPTAKDLAALRKRYERLKARLRERMTE
ncbi:MAG: sigma-70 family RNA polymerase sigma factor [Kofleriaceae bacterium]